MTTYYLGVDPGKSGGLVALTEDGSVDSAVAMPRTERGVWEWFHGYRQIEEGTWAAHVTTGAPVPMPPQQVYACIELVSGYIGSRGNRGGGAGNTGSSMFVFGQSYGALRMALTGAGIKWGNKGVPPVVWQRHFGIAPRGKGEAKEAFKRRLKARAAELFPDLKVTLAQADALLLALYCKYLYRGKP